jgi:peptidoglycan/LPS O-acetylase OafA/YrhL
LLAAAAAMAIVATLAFGWFSVIGYPALAYLVLWLAASLPRSFQWIGRKNDYSYGIYIYGWLVQQFTALLGWYHWGYWPWVVSSLALAFGFAWLSWHGVEKHALALKDAGPGRGIRYWYSRMARTPRPGV